MHFPGRKTLRNKRPPTVKAVDGVSLAVPDGQTLAVVGESGCGKSTLGRAILRVNEPTAAASAIAPRRGDWVDLTHLGNAALAKYRLDLRMIFQDPFTALNPRQTVLEAIGQPLFAHGVNRGEIRERVAEIMGKVGLRPEYMSRYPHAFSGGERQRIVIARALVVRPHVVVADEAVAALDVSVRAQTLNLLQDLQDELQLTYLFISHDLSVVRHISSNVAVVCRPADRVRAHRKPVPPAAPSLHLGAAVLDPDQFARSAGQDAAAATGRGSRRSGQSADRLPLSSALPARHRQMSNSRCRSRRPPPAVVRSPATGGTNWT